MLHLAKALVIPPLGLYVLGAIGLFVVRRHPRTGRSLMVLAAATLVVLSLPWTAGKLLASLETAPALDPRARGLDAQAIVVLSADYEPMRPEFGRAMPGPLSLERIVYAAHLARASELPVLVSGGVLEPNAPPAAEVLAEVLRRRLGVEARWTETRSRTTRENARYSARVLLPAGIRRVALVTHAWHIPRARAAFERAGFEVTPAPTAFSGGTRAEHLPTSNALRQSTWAIHEWIGRLWYALIDRGGDARTTEGH